MRIPRTLRLTLLPLLLLPVASGVRGAEPAAAVPLAEVAAGQRGYGLSVFTGRAPQRFEVEVLGVLRNVSPETSYILGRLSGQGLEATGVIAGMSGSPVYLDGRLAGAVAFAWPFAKEAIAGITPIEAMRDLIGPPAGLAARPMGAHDLRGTLRLLVRGEAPVELLSERLQALMPQVPGGGASALQWTAVGFGEASRSLLARALGPLAPAGTVAGSEPIEITPGGAVAGVLVDGDLRFAVTGTVTDRIGDEVLAFGHPFLGVGPLRLPMAPAEVIAVLPSSFSSFKIASFGPVVGAFDLDRLPGVRGRLGLQAPTVPLSVSVRGEGERRFEMQVADLPGLTPTLLAIGLLGGLDVAVGSAGEQGLDLDMAFAVGRHGELRMRQSFDGSGAALQAAIYTLLVSQFLLENSLEEVALDEVRLEVQHHAAPRTALLVGGHATRTQVRPGDRVALNLDFRAYRGEAFRRSLEVEVPSGLPAGRYSILVGDGPSLDAARLSIERAEPVSFGQALDLLRSFHSRRELVAYGVVPADGLAVAGEVLPRLPASIRSLWEASSAGSAVPLRLAVGPPQVVLLDHPVQGIVRIDLEMERAEPLGEPPAGGEDGADEGGGDGDVDGGEEGDAGRGREAP